MQIVPATFRGLQK